MYDPPNPGATRERPRRHARTQQRPWPAPAQVTITLPDGSSVTEQAAAKLAEGSVAALVYGGTRLDIDISRVERAREQDLLERWCCSAAGKARFGAHAFELRLGGYSLALLCAAHADEQVVESRLALHRRNCIELCLLAGAPGVLGSDARRLLARLWRRCFALAGWPHYPDVVKVALVCRPTTSGARDCLDRGDGWQPAIATRGFDALWVCWLDERPHPGASALTREPAPAPVAAIARAA